MNRLCLLALFVAAPLACGDDATLARMKKDLYFLAGEECEGRGLKTEGINKAAAYIADEFKAAGLKAPGTDYFQKFGLKESQLSEGPHELTISNDAGSTKHEFKKQFTVSGLSGKGKATGNLVFVGYGISSEKYDDYKGVDVKGNIVVVMRQYPRARAKKDAFMTEEESRKHSPLAEKIKLAEKNGASAVIFLNDADMAGKDDPLMAFDYASEDGKIGTIPVLHAKRSVIEPFLGKKLAEIESAIDRDLKPQSFVTKAPIQVEATLAVKELPVKNIVGVLEGVGPLANETVVIGAHYDHLGRGERGSKTLGNTEVHYGADDNASGTTALLELARRFGARKDRVGRRIVFLAFTGEERGLLGSLHYCQNPVFPLKDTVAMLNMDMLGRLRADKNGKDMITVGGVGSAKSFEKLLDDSNRNGNFKFDKVKSGTGPSDHTSFYLAKVPVYFFFTGDHPEYHTPKDKPDTINYEGILKVADMVDSLTTTIAAAAERPEYVAGMGGSMSGGPQGPKLGLMPRYDDAETKGMEIAGVVPGGAAEGAGLKQGDRITAIDGKPVKNVQDYMKAMAGLKRGVEVEITFERDTKPMKAKAAPK